MAHSQKHAPSIAFEYASDEALILHEFSHRTANQIASAAAALHLVKAASPGSRLDFIDQAARQLTAFGEVHRVLARPVRATVDVAEDLSSICRAVASGSSLSQDSSIRLDAPPTWVSGALGRRLVLVAAELISNAMRHALDGRSGLLKIELRVSGEDVVLRVKDDGPGMRPAAATSGTGLGSGIIAQLVDRAGGSIGIDTGARGTSVRVVFPLTSCLDADDSVPF